MALVHPESHPLADKKIKVALRGNPMQALHDGVEMRVEDWWSWAHEDNERQGDQPQLLASMSPAAQMYVLRAKAAGLPVDDDVIYGKVRVAPPKGVIDLGGQGVGVGYIIHSSEIGEVVPD
jgi:hypothetical protein